MAILKCKMCGGDIELSADKTFGTCEYCGSTMTFPKVDDEQRAAAFNRGNHFRRIGEFDKALAVYERIVREDDTDAEAHWCCALCRFGIEYVEDPASYEYVPTCHRASFDSFLEDVDYLAAVEHSDGITRRQYQKDAARIAEVQRGILATSQNTEPYDVFICYKESDANGDRTRDSLLAQDIYYQLTEQGRKVFFARITLEDIAGAQYEPYIFAALNSAKVMIVVGTKPEHLSAVWVKNEWSRFLAMMKKDHSKLLLPCYRDMDPYDMPEQLSVLQSYDMGKIGFIQDLTRGIAKVLDAEKKQESMKETAVLQQSTVAMNNTAPLLKRAFMFLEDGDWNSANEYCEKVLDIDPESAEAYLGKLMAELRVKKQEALKDCINPFEHSANYQKAVRFAEDQLVEELKGYVAFIKERNQNTRNQVIYVKAQKAMISAKSAWYTKAEADYRATAKQFQSIKGYKDADKLAEECLRLAEEARKNAIYREALEMSKKEDKVSLRGAASRFYSIRDWKDSAEKEAECKKRMEEIDCAQQKAAKRVKMIVIIAAIAVVVVAVALILIKSVIIPNSKYNQAKDLMEAGEFQEAVYVLNGLHGYRDSEDKIKECKSGILDNMYDDAVALMDEGKYTEAITAFKALAGHKDSKIKIEECENGILNETYNSASALMEDGEYQKAVKLFETIKDYKDSISKITECNASIQEIQYNDAVSLMNTGKYAQAYELFAGLIDYKDSKEFAIKTRLEKNKPDLKNCRVGSYIMFGVYEQDNNMMNGQEEIEWKVLEIKNGKALVVSKYALDAQPFNKSGEDVSWEDSSVRKWLNNDFINTAFSEEERNMIPTVTISNEQKNSSMKPIKSTRDQIFLLSLTEVNEYFTSDISRKCKPTKYALGRGAKIYDATDGEDSESYGNCWWSLRTRAGLVFYNGVALSNAATINSRRSIRPALWIDLSAIE